MHCMIDEKCMKEHCGPVFMVMVLAWPDSGEASTLSAGELREKGSPRVGNLSAVKKHCLVVAVRRSIKKTFLNGSMLISLSLAARDTLRPSYVASTSVWRTIATRFYLFNYLPSPCILFRYIVFQPVTLISMRIFFPVLFLSAYF